MKNNIKKIIVVSLVIFPFITLAQAKNLKSLIDLIIEYFTLGVWLILALAVLLFVWNVFKYFILSGDDVGKKSQAALYVMWSVIGFFVILSLWGLVSILRNTFNLDDTVPSFGIFGTFKTTTVPNKTFSDPNGSSTIKKGSIGPGNNTTSGTVGGGNTTSGSTGSGGSTVNGSTGGISNTTVIQGTTGDGNKKIEGTTGGQSTPTN